MVQQNSNLPAAIVRQILEKSQEVARRSGEMAADFVLSRTMLRDSMADAGLIAQVPDLDPYPRLTASAVDGAMIVERKRFGDVCAALAVEAAFPADGVTDGSHDCEVWMDSIRRHARNGVASGAVMSSQEVRLAVRASSEMVMLDGSFVSTLINMSTGIVAAREMSGSYRGEDNPLVRKVFELRSDEMRADIMELISGRRYVAFPKYTTTNEFEEHLPTQFRDLDARTVSTIALEPGEMTVYVPPARHPSSDSNKDLLSPSLGFEGQERQRFLEALESIQSFYYRPHAWSPAFRIDVTGAADDPDWLPSVLRTVRDATRIAGMSEPLPLYLADQWAKQISTAASPAVGLAAMSMIDDPQIKTMLALDYRTN